MKYFKIAGKIVLWIVVIFFIVLLFQYILAPVYDFPKPEPFSGNKIFNPYQHADSLFWKKANFQVQSRVWGGITDGRENSNKMIDSVYRFLEYDIIGISDYMQINKYKSGEKSYIPIYEHGYGVLKHHQICIGAEKVNWRDYFLYQSIHHKQHVINILRDDNDLVILAHPKLREAYKPSELKWLTNYDGIEILNYFGISINYWDPALSSGHYVIAMGNDDAHNVTDSDEVGNYCTFIYTESNAGDSVINALKKGRSFAAKIYRPADQPFEDKKRRIKDIAVLKKAKVINDSFFVEVDRKAYEFRFIGQNGELKKTVKNSCEAHYTIKPEDTYIRTEILFPSKNIYYLNPIAKYSDKWPPEKPILTRNITKTWIYRIIFGATLLFIIMNIIILTRRFKRKRRKSKKY